MKSWCCTPSYLAGRYAYPAPLLFSVTHKSDNYLYTCQVRRVARPLPAIAYLQAREIPGYQTFQLHHAIR